MNQNDGLKYNEVPIQGQEDFSNALSSFIEADKSKAITQKQRDEWTKYLWKRSLDFLNRECPQYMKIDATVVE